MSSIKISALALSVASALMFANGAASAGDSSRGHYITFWGGSQYVASEAVTGKVRAHNGHAAQTKLRDNNAPTASLSAREFFDRLSSRSR